MRRLIAFGCLGETLLGTLDEGPGACGVLIVSGGNEIRAGAHRGMAQLAAALAAEGHPVFRFDRRGVGDSSGDNAGFAGSAADIAAAADAFRTAAPGVRRLAGFGLCDGATALALFHRAARIDALILANPWLVEPVDAMPPPAAIGAHYRRRLADPRAWARLARGGVDLAKLVRGLRQLAAPRPPAPLADQMATALAETLIPVTILLAARDHTAAAFRAEWARPAFDGLRLAVAIETLDSDSHSFAPADDKAWLLTQVLAALQ